MLCGSCGIFGRLLKKSGNKWDYDIFALLKLKDASRRKIGLLLKESYQKMNLEMRVTNE